MIVQHVPLCRQSILVDCVLYDSYCYYNMTDTIFMDQQIELIIPLVEAVERISLLNLSAPHPHDWSRSECTVV